MPFIASLRQRVRVAIAALAGPVLTTCIVPFLHYDMVTATAIG